MKWNRILAVIGLMLAVTAITLIATKSSTQHSDQPEAKKEVSLQLQIGPNLNEAQSPITTESSATGYFYTPKANDTINEIQQIMSFGGTLPLYWGVWEEVSGGYKCIFEKSNYNTPSAGFGQQWYSSGKIETHLVAGTQYFIGCWWTIPPTVYRQNASAPFPQTTTNSGTIHGSKGAMQPLTGPLSPPLLGKTIIVQPSTTQEVGTKITLAQK